MTGQPDRNGAHRPITVLFDVVHPVDVLFFRRPIATLEARGDRVVVASRRKDVACDLLDAFGIAHHPVSRLGRGVLGLGLELIRRDLGVLRLARRERPDVMVGFGGVAIAHVGKLLGIPTVSFYDHEDATLQTRLTWPFIGRLYVPERYDGPVPEGRTRRLAGTKDLSYLHPDHFRVDDALARAGGREPGADHFLIRLVGWGANHDIGKTGWDDVTVTAVAGRLSALGRVHISSERPLPTAVEAWRYRGPVEAIHHLMARCRLLVGESASMAGEAATLGVPAIYAGRDHPGYVRELEAAGLIDLPAPEQGAVLAAVEARLAEPPERFRATWQSYIAGKPDWGAEVVRAVDGSVAR